MSKLSRFLSFVAAVVFAAALGTDARAQICPNASDVFYKNDIFPQVTPSTGLALAIVPGLCEGEAAGSVFTLSGPGPQKLTQVSCPFMSPSGTGLPALVNLVVYDNVTFNGAGVPQMNNVVFDLTAATGNEIQLGYGLNTIDVSSYNIQVTGPKFVVAFFMSFNPNGSCALGHTSNFFTDNTPCVDQKNLIFIQGQGWVDSKKANVLGFPLCGLFYNGNWVIRACAEPNTNPYFVQVFGSPALPGQFVNLTFNAPGYAGKLYVAAASGSTNVGIPLPPHGVFPLDYDPLLEFVVLGGGGGKFINFISTVGPAGTAPGLILIPPTVSPGVQFYVAFVAFDALNPAAPWAISDAAIVQIQ
jgi:hypothetical protein